MLGLTKINNLLILNFITVTWISSSAGGDISIPGKEEMPEDSLPVEVRYLTGPDFSPIFKRKLTLESARGGFFGLPRVNLWILFPSLALAGLNAAVDRRKTGDTSSDED